MNHIFPAIITFLNFRVVLAVSLGRLHKQHAYDDLGVFLRVKTVCGVTVVHLVEFFRSPRIGGGFLHRSRQENARRMRRLWGCVCEDRNRFPLWTPFGWGCQMVVRILKIVEQSRVVSLVWHCPVWWCHGWVWIVSGSFCWGIQANALHGPYFLDTASLGWVCIALRVIV